MQYNFSIYKCSMCSNCVTAAESRLVHSRSCFRTEIFCNLYIIRFQTRLLFCFYLQWGCQAYSETERDSFIPCLYLALGLLEHSTLNTLSS